jgi:signal transduction histidine kinase
LITLDGFHFTKTLRNDGVLLCEGVRDSDQAKVLAKFLMNPSHDSAKAIDLRHSYEMSQRFRDLPIAEHLFFQETYKQIIVVEEQLDGCTLQAYISKGRLEPFKPRERLQLALDIAKSLAHFHHRNLWHLNLQARHIQIVDNSGPIYLLDLTSVAEQLGKLYIPPGVHHPKSRHSDLLAPEQLGMIDRRVDGRADLFQLGNLFFEMFAGQPPFPTQGDSVIRLTFKPQILRTFNSQLPGAVYALVERLLHFDPDQRVQHIDEVIACLSACLGQEAPDPYETTEPTRPEYNYRYTFKLEERDRLHHLLDRTLEGKHTWVTVGGPAGHDKSHIIRDLKGHVISKGGLFIESACNPIHRLTPHAPLRLAIGTWINLLWHYYPNILEEMQRKTQRALGKNSGLLEGIIPHWEKLIPRMPPTPSLPADMARNRFKFVFREFVTTFLDTPIPVVLVFDDMQWADESSLELLSLIRHSVQPSNLMVIAAYRDQPKKPKQFQSWHSEHFEIQPFNVEQIQEIIRGTFADPPSDPAEMAQLIHRNTNGTPFSVWQLLDIIRENCEIAKAPGGEGCIWNLVEMQNRLPRRQVRDWANHQVAQLPEETQNILAHAAHVGRNFTLKELAVLTEVPLESLRDHLLTGLKFGVLQPRSHCFAKLPWMQNEHLDQNQRLMKFRFDNNLIHGALAEKLPLEKRGACFSALANYYTDLQGDNPNARFWVADYYQHAVEMGTDVPWLTRVTAHARAGRQAKHQHALASASLYYARAVDLCEDQHWNEHFELMFSLHLEAIECAYLCRDESSAAWLHETLIEKVTDPSQRSEIFHRQSAFLRDRIRLKDALTSYLRALSELQINLPLNQPEMLSPLIAEVEERLRSSSKEELINLAPLTDPKLQQACLILGEILPLAYFIGKETFLSVVYFGLKLILEEGHHTSSARVFGAYSAMMVARDHQFAFEMAQIAEHLDREHETNIPDPGSRGFLMIFVHHWFRPISEVIQELRNEIDLATEYGDMDGFNYGIASVYASSAAYGYCLRTLKKEAQNTMPLLKEFGLTFSTSMMLIWEKFVTQLREGGKTPWRMQTTGLETILDPDIEVQSQLEHNLRLQFHLAQLMLSLIFRQVHHAAEHAELAEAHLTNYSGMPNVPKLIFYSTLAFIQAGKVNPDIKEDLQDKIEKNIGLMKTWAHFAPANRNHELALIRAEMATPDQDINPVIEQYDLAIETARQHGYLHEQALASELAGEFYLSRHREVIGRTYLNEARNLYQEWGATAKVKQLNQRAMQLEQAVSDNTAMLEKINRMNREIANTQKQLMEQESMANLGTLTAGITHEIRNPLNFITNFAAVGVELFEDLRQTLKKYKAIMGEDFEDVMTLIDDLANNNSIIQKQGARAENIVRAMLRVSRNAKDRPRPTLLNQLLDEDINLAYHGHAKRTGLGVKIHRNFSEEVKEVDLVARNISRVFLNLLNNAFYALAERKEEAGDQFQPEIWVSTRPEDEMVVVDVTDNGTGIEPDILATIFTPFFTTKPTGEGTGIGLAMSKEIVEKEHYGNLSVTSDLGRATTFTVRIPLKQADNLG